LKGTLLDSASINSWGLEIPTGRGNRMMIYPRWESRAQWIEPIRRRQRKKSKMGIEKKQYRMDLKGMRVT
jgi:hypothetical protein